MRPGRPQTGSKRRAAEANRQGQEWLSTRRTSLKVHNRGKDGHQLPLDPLEDQFQGQSQAFYTTSHRLRAALHPARPFTRPE